MKRVFAAILTVLVLFACKPTGTETPGGDPGGEQPGGEVTPGGDPGGEQPGVNPTVSVSADGFNAVADADYSGGWEFDVPAEPPVPVTYYSNPVYTEYNAPDPTWIKVGKYIYSYSTGDNIHIIRSTDLVHWEFIGRAFTNATRPRWITKVDGTDAGIWAPDINYFGGRYVMYYSLSGNKKKADGSGNQDWKGIGVATASSPEGPFTDHGKVVEDGDLNVAGTDIAYTIDPVFFSENGVNYLCWGSFRRIFLTELTDDGLALKYPGDGSKVTVIGCAQWEGSIIHKRGQYYYYIGSNGNPLKGEDSDYRAQVARSTSLFGPYVSKDGKNLSKAATLTPLLYGNDTFIAPGHTSQILTDDEGNDWIAYHGYRKGEAKGNNRKFFIDRIDWTEDGWPVINGGAGPTTVAEAPVFGP